jgi:LmbE family N-acetylglucosaminyl deacetylase
MTIRDYFRYAYRAFLPVIYGRTNFKLFLKTSLAHYDSRVRQLASVTDYFSGFVRPIPISAPFGKSMLVVAPHQDDEAIGCGGALALQARAGRPAFVVLLQDGADEHEAVGMTRAQMTALRNDESRRAAAFIGIPPPVFLDHADLVANAPAAAEAIQAIIADRKIDAVFVPFMLDGHPHHRQANYILADALKNIPWNVRVLGYEVWGFCIPNVIVIIDNVIKEKLAMIRCFASANKALDYVHSTEGLNMYHSRMLASGTCRYAERFFEIPSSEYIDLVARVRAGEDSAPATPVK